MDELYRPTLAAAHLSRYNGILAPVAILSIPTKTTGKPPEHCFYSIRGSVPWLLLRFSLAFSASTPASFLSTSALVGVRGVQPHLFVSIQWELGSVTLSPKK